MPKSTEGKIRFLLPQRSVSPVSPALEPADAYWQIYDRLRPGEGW